METQYDLLMDISILYRSAQKYYDSKLQDYGLTYGQLPMMIYVFENEGISMQKIALEGGYDKGTVTKNIQKLENLGYIQVLPNPKDKRAKECYTTDIGKQIMNDIYEIRREWWKHIIRSLDPGKLDDFSEFYQAMAANARDYAKQSEKNIQFFEHVKVSLFDYPDKIATTLAMHGCTFHCPHCTRSHLIYLKENALEIDLFEIQDYLEKRKGIIEAVVIRNPEPFMHPELFDFLNYVKSLGYKVKIETNGSFPNRLKAAVEQNLVDFVSMDIKNDPARYAQTIGLKNYDIEPVQESVDFLLSNKVDYEFRTTLVKEFHSIPAIIEMAKWIKGANRYVIQSYKAEDNRNNLHGFEPEEMERIGKIVQTIIENTIIKGE